jgi:hypothetical protein
VTIYNSDNQPPKFNKRVNSNIRVCTISDVEVGSMIDVTSTLGRPGRGIYIIPSDNSEPLIVLNAIQKDMDPHDKSRLTWALSPSQGAQIEIDREWTSGESLPGLEIDSFYYADNKMDLLATITIVIY